MWKRIRDLIYPVCPSCHGSGGSEGYWGGDWTGCFCCNQNEDREESVVRIWFWQVWRHRYDLWKLDRWVSRQMEAELETKYGSFLAHVQIVFFEARKLRDKLEGDKLVDGLGAALNAHDDFINRQSRT